jgi:hypothetical protein
MIIISQILSLKTLYLDDIAITNIGLSRLLSLTKLAELSLCFIPIDIDGIRYISKLPSLQKITMIGIPDTPNDMEAVLLLSHIPDVIYITLLSCHYVDDPEFAKVNIFWK